MCTYHRCLCFLPVAEISFLFSITILQRKSATASPQAPPSGSPPSGGFIVNSYGGYSKKGYAPYNPKKKNQDALVMAEDPKTRSLLLCVMDGHGEDGDKISQNIKSKLANYLFKHRDFATDAKAAIADVVARCETEVLRGELLMASLSCLHDRYFLQMQRLRSKRTSLEQLSH